MIHNHVEKPVDAVFPRNILDDLTFEQRMYYRETWGFDPVLDRKPLRYGKNFLLTIVGQIEEESPEEFDSSDESLSQNETKDYYYEACFGLDADPGLQFAGVTIAARVEVYSDGTFHNYIVFRQGHRLTRVDCVHTIVHFLPPVQGGEKFPPEAGEDLRSTEFRPAILPPWEHFAALKSYAGGIAATGLKNLLLAVYADPDPEENYLLLPFGFNALMQEQVLRAIRELSPVAALAISQDVIGQLLEEKPEEWLRENFEELDKIWDVKAVGRSSLDLFLQLDRVLQSKEFRISAHVSPDTHPDVKKYLDSSSSEPQTLPYFPRKHRTSLSARILATNAPSEVQNGHLNYPALFRDKTTLSQYEKDVQETLTSDYRNQILRELILGGNTITYKMAWYNYFILAVIMPFYSIFPLVATVGDPQYLPFGILISLGVMSPITLMIISFALTCLEITPEGFKYRNLWGTKQCEWGNVSDIDYQTIRKYNSRSKSLCVECLDGKTIVIPEIDALRSAICPKKFSIQSVMELYSIRNRAWNSLKKEQSQAKF